MATFVICLGYSVHKTDGYVGRQSEIVQDILDAKVFNNLCDAEDAGARFSYRPLFITTLAYAKKNWARGVGNVQ